MSRSYLQFFSSLPGRAVAGAVVGTVALGTVALGTSAGALASSGPSTMIAKSQARAAAPLKGSQVHAAAPLQGKDAAPRQGKDAATHLVKADTAIRLAEQQVGIREDQAGE